MGAQLALQRWAWSTVAFTERRWAEATYAVFGQPGTPFEPGKEDPGSVHASPSHSRGWCCAEDPHIEQERDHRLQQQHQSDHRDSQMRHRLRDQHPAQAVAEARERDQHRERAPARDRERHPFRRAYRAQAYRRSKRYQRQHLFHRRRVAAVDMRLRLRPAQADVEDRVADAGGESEPDAPAVLRGQRVPAAAEQQPQPKERQREPGEEARTEPFTEEQHAGQRHEEHLRIGQQRRQTGADQQDAAMPRPQVDGERECRHQRPRQRAWRQAAPGARREHVSSNSTPANSMRQNADTVGGVSAMRTIRPLVPMIAAPAVIDSARAAARAHVHARRRWTAPARFRPAPRPASARMPAVHGSHRRMRAHRRPSRRT